MKSANSQAGNSQANVRRSLPRRLRSRLGLLAVAFGVAALLWLSPFWCRSLLKEWMQQRIDAAADRQAAEIVRTAPALGPQGMELLAEAAGSYRQSVARAAQAVLYEQIDRWQRADHRQQAGREMAALARSLAAQIEQYGPAARRFAAQLVEQMQRLPARENVSNGVAFVADCHHVLDTAARAGFKPQSERSVRFSFETDGAFARADQAVNPSSPNQQDPGDRASRDTNGSRSQEPRRLYIHDEPNDSVHRMPPGRFARPLQVRRVPPAAPGADAARMDRQAARQRRSPGEVQESGEATAQVFTGSAAAPNEAISLPRQNGESGVRKEQSKRLPSLPTDDLLGLLHHDDQATRDRAAGELADRGYDPRVLEMTRRLSHPDRQVRLQLAQELSASSGSETRKWLLWLSEDEDAEVRFTALSTLATTGDPQLQSRIYELARFDRDPRIQQLAKQIKGR